MPAVLAHRPGAVASFSRTPALLGWLLCHMAVAGAAPATAPAAAPPAAPPAAPAAAPAPVASVRSFSPQGYVKAPRQAVATFSLPMVALGDPHLPDPFTVQCPPEVTGKGRWIDVRHWAYDFDADLDGGVSCRFALKSGVRSVAGATVSGHAPYEFNTGGPSILGSMPREGESDLDEAQVFILRLDAPASVASIEAHASCAIEGVGERVGVNVLSGAERTAILNQRKALGYDYYQILWKQGTTTSLRVRNRSMEQAEAFLSVLRCQRPLPPATKVVLDWGAGIASASGIVRTHSQRLEFRVRAAFTAQVECTRTNPRAGCAPIQPIHVNFTAPVPRERALAIRLRAADGTIFSPAPAPDTAPSQPNLAGVNFQQPFPENSTVTVLLPPDLIDDSGRRLENAARFPLAVRVDAFPPLVKFSGDFGILESTEGGVLPVTLRNVEPNLSAQQVTLPAKMLRLDADPAAIAGWLRRVQTANESRGDWIDAPPPAAGEPALKQKLDDQEESEDSGEPARVWQEKTGSDSVFGASDAVSGFTLAKPGGAKPMEVVGIALKQPGFYVVEVQSQVLGESLLGAGKTRYVSTAALVTDLAVHFKWGLESSRVWVTRLSDGAPVAHADVVISDACSGEQRWQGQSDAGGIATVTQSLGDPERAYGRCEAPQHPLIVVAKRGEDYSFTLSNWNRGIEPSDFGLHGGESEGAGIAHTVLDRALFRAGETVSMKHFLREHHVAGLTLPAGAAGKHEVAIRHEGGDESFKTKLMFGADGTATGEWKIPTEAKLGHYTITIDDQTSAHFKVEQFRLPSMRATLTGPARPQVNPKQVDLDLHVAYLSGGGAGGLPVKLRTLVEPAPSVMHGYEDYQFGGKVVQAGIVSGGEADEDLDFEASPELKPTRTRTIPVTLDANGTARVSVDQLPLVDVPSRLTAELEYADANGETLSASGHVPLVPAGVSLGIRTEGWVTSSEQLRLRVVALDLDGKPVSQQKVQVALYQANSYSYRKRLLGGFYPYETVRETRKLGAACSGATDARGLLLCELAPGVSGELLVRAETRDGQGALAGATASVYAFGKDDLWFGGTSGDRMDLLPEKKEYEVGDKARFQVRMPFRTATALVTVEREGVLSSFVTHLTGQLPVVEVPIDAGYAPNVYVSVLALRGRIAHPEHAAGGSTEDITALVDLNKPAYRLGLAQIRVGWKPHRLDVQVLPDQKIYKVRDQASVQVHVTAADGSRLPAGSEVALAAVDEALLDLAPNNSWDLLTSMMGERGLNVHTSTGQMQVIGKRHYGRKAVPHGGGGGRELGNARELFDSLLYWNPRVVLDAAGNARVTVPLNDSLSAFRIVAVASSGAERFGSGSATVSTTQDLILLSGLPPLVREGDRFTATVTLRNTTTQAISALVRPVSTTLKEPLPAVKVMVPGGESRDVNWLVAAPVGATHIDWDVSASDASGGAHDRVKVVQQVIPLYPVRTYQATIAQLDSPLTIPLQQPQGSLPGAGRGQRLTAGQPWKPRWRARIHELVPVSLPGAAALSSHCDTLAHTVGCGGSPFAGVHGSRRIAALLSHGGAGGRRHPDQLRARRGGRGRLADSRR